MDELEGGWRLLWAPSPFGPPWVTNILQCACSFEAVGGIVMEGRSYQKDRYVGEWMRVIHVDKPYRVARSLFTKLRYGALPRGGGKP